MSYNVHVGANSAAWEDELCTRMLAQDDIEPWERDEDSIFHVPVEEDMPDFGPESTPEPSANEPSVTTDSSAIVQEPSRFSFYKRPIKNVVPCDEITLVDLYQIVTSDEAKATTEQLRAISDEDKAKEFKKWNFDYVTPAGIFTKRENAALVIPSGLMVIDIDDLKDSAEVESVFQLLLNIPRLETQLLFRSPGGLGLKWFIPIVNNEGHDHRFYFQAVSNYLKTYDVIVDPSGKDVSRACYIPCDPQAFIHPKYL